MRTFVTTPHAIDTASPRTEINIDYVSTSKPFNFIYTTMQGTLLWRYMVQDGIESSFITNSSKVNAQLQLLTIDTVT